MTDLETRSAPLEIRVESADSGPVLRFSAAVFNQLSGDLGGFLETIEPGFFRDVLDGDTVAAWEHRTDFVLGRTTATPPTLTLAESPTALVGECFPADNSRNRDWVLTPIERGEVRHMSFSFRVGQGGDQWEELPDGRMLRTLLPGGCSALPDVSPVTRAAYTGTDIGLRSLERWKDSIPHQPVGATDKSLRLEVLRFQARQLTQGD